MKLKAWQAYGVFVDQKPHAAGSDAIRRADRSPSFLATLVQIYLSVFSSKHLQKYLLTTAARIYYWRSQGAISICGNCRPVRDRLSRTARDERRRTVIPT
jgi:hypothetical protein